jgi:hypothetical protein
MADDMLIVDGLDQIGAMMIEEDYGESPEPLDGNAAAGSLHGDFGLLAVGLVLGAAAINALATYLAKTRDTESAKEDITVIVEPGRVRVDVSRTKRKTHAEAPDADTVKAISEGIVAAIKTAGGVVPTSPPDGAH